MKTRYRSSITLQLSHRLADAKHFLRQLPINAFYPITHPLSFLRLRRSRDHRWLLGCRRTAQKTVHSSASHPCAYTSNIHSSSFWRRTSDNRVSGIHPPYSILKTFLVCFQS